MTQKAWVKTTAEFTYCGAAFGPGVTIGCDPEDAEIIAGLDDGRLVPGEMPKEACRTPDEPAG